MQGLQPAGARRPGDVFACPGCHRRLHETDDDLQCNDCGVRYPLTGGFLDLAPDLRHQAGLGQRLMESRGLSRVYERGFRPALTWLGSSLRYRDEDAYLARWLKPASPLVLDLACGTGRYARQLSACCSATASQVVGLDLSLAMLTRARAHRAHGILYARGDAQALPFEAGRVGAVNCFGALHLFPDPEAAIVEIGRVTAAAGTFTCLTARRARDGLRGRVQRRVSRLYRFAFFDEHELDNWLDAAGFDLLDVTVRGSVVMFAARRRTGDLRPAPRALSHTRAARRP